MGGIFINKKLFFIGKKSSAHPPHHPITPSTPAIFNLE
jgi:hypothetical protein